jgi:flagellar hook-length control protein FliK
MYAAPLETDYRSSTPAVSRGTPRSSDLFAELLRRHAEVSEPAPQPEEEAARPATRPQRDRAPAEDADTTRPADADDTAPVAAETDPTHSTEKSVAADGGNDAATPADHEPRTATAETTSPAKPAADAAVSAQPAAPEPLPTPAPTVLLAAVPATPTDLAPDAAAAPNSAAPASAVGAPAPAAANAPIVDPDVPLPAPLAPLAADPAAADPAAADPATMPRPAADAPAQPAENLPPRPRDSVPPRMATAPAAAAPAGDAQTAAAATQSAPASDSMADDPQIDVRVQVQRSTDATQAQGPVQGLGKLGTGAEIALAAQAIGDAQRRIATDAGKPEITAKPQPAAGNAGAGANAAAQPAATTANASAANGGQAAATTAPQRTADATGSTFDAALGAATGATDHDGTGLPGTAADTGLRAAGTTTGATAASLRTAAIHGSPAEQVAIQVQRAVRDGASRITVQLRPAELGAVEVRLDFAQDGRVSATILADRADTLDMLQRDARTLERSLQDAGLKADSSSLSFDLRDGSRNGPGSQQMAGGNREGNPTPARPGRQATADAGSAQPTMASTADGGVDIRV